MQLNQDSTVSRRNLLQGWFGSRLIIPIIVKIGTETHAVKSTTGMAGFAALSSGALGASAAEKAKQPEFIKLESGLSYQDKVKKTGALVNLEQSVAAVSPLS